VLANRDLKEIEQLLRPVELAPLPDNPLVSVLTANYNYAGYIREAIESVQAQTYTNFEVIVCDDGSTDESCEVVESYAKSDPRIKLTRKENGGVASALNAAYRESKGQIVCLLDADDRFLPEKLEMVVGAFRSHPDSGFLGHPMFQMSADGLRLGVTPLLRNHPSGWYGPFVVRYADFPPGLSFGSALCLRRAISDLIFPMAESFRSGADGVLMALAPLMTPIVGIPVPLTEYRFHGRNVTNTAHITSEFLDGELRIEGIYWELRRAYLAGVHPRLGKMFRRFDERMGTLINNYTQTRLQGNKGALPVYLTLIRHERFVTLHPAARWFWRLSVLLPRPVFRCALDVAMRPSPLKQLVWRVMRSRKVRVGAVANESSAA
jgi:glycosyltransferase involved in cell wall biosynthesis